MVVDRRFCLVNSGPKRPMFGDRPGLYHEGEWIDYRVGEFAGDAVKRHLAKKAAAAKLSAQRTDDARKIAKSSPKKRGIEGKLKFTGFKAFGPKPAA